MTDDPTKRGSPDSLLISLKQRHEVRYWTNALGVTRTELTAAIKAVGHSADRVRAYLKERAAGDEETEAGKE